MLTYYGIEVQKDYILRLSGTTKDGANMADIFRVLDYYGLSYKAWRMTPKEIKAGIDIGEPRAGQRLVDTVVARFGRLDVAVDDVG